MGSLRALAGSAGGLGLSLSLACLGGACMTAPAPSEDLEATESAIEQAAKNSLPGKRVLLLPVKYEEPGDTRCFLENARELERWYEEKGATADVVQLGFEPDDLYAALASAAADGKKYDRLITLGHGGADGLVFVGEGSNVQIGLNWPHWAMTEEEIAAAAASAGSSGDAGRNADDEESVSPLTEEEIADARKQRAENRAKLTELGRLIHAVTTQGSFVYLGQCNPGKPSGIEPALTYVQLNACVSGRRSFGTSSKTACWDITRRVKLLEAPTPKITATLTSATPESITSSGAFTCIDP